MSEVAVVLMAYGSPDRLEDVPAYYSDIRSGRPIRPELLDSLVERYRRLGIEDENPLNAITEETRARLEAELECLVFTGMKHWTPRIADAAERAVGSGATTVVGLVLAPHYSRGSIAGYREQLETSLDGRAELAFVDSWHDDPALVTFLADRICGRTGRDFIHPGLGPDIVHAGSGNDVIFANRDDLSRDRISCGPGRDLVVADRTDRVERDCEEVHRRFRR